MNEAHVLSKLRRRVRRNRERLNGFPAAIKAAEATLALHRESGDANQIARLTGHVDRLRSQFTALTQWLAGQPVFPPRNPAPFVRQWYFWITPNSANSADYPRPVRLHGIVQLRAWNAVQASRVSL